MNPKNVFPIIWEPFRKWNSTFKVSASVSDPAGVLLITSDSVHKTYLLAIFIVKKILLSIHAIYWLMRKLVNSFYKMGSLVGNYIYSPVIMVTY